MSYDWKQLSAKIAKVGISFLVLGGASAIGGAAQIPVLLGTLKGETIASGLGEIVEGIVSGIQPKDPAVYTQFQSAVKKCVMNQMKKMDFPNGKALQSDIMKFFFGEKPGIFAAVAEPQKTAADLKTIFEKHIPNKTISDEEAACFINGLLSEVIKVIEEKHEFTAVFYLKRIIEEIKLFKQFFKDENDKNNLMITEKLNTLHEEVTLIHNLLNGGMEQSGTKRAQTKYTFAFEIGADGKALEISNATQNAIREWFYDYACDDLSTVTDENLADTFTVTIDDQRVKQAQVEIDILNIRIKAGESLDAFREYTYSESKKTVNRIHKENMIRAAAIKFYLSDRFGYGVFNTLDYRKLWDMIIKILELPYYTTDEGSNPHGYIALDVYLNSSGENQDHEEFMVYMKERDVKACFGGTGIYDLFGSAVCDMGKYVCVIAPYFYLHLGELKVDKNFDFSLDKRILNLYSYFIGLK